MTPLSRKDTLTSCQVDEPSMATKSSVSSKRVMITRKSHAAGSTRQSICTSQMYTQTINPHIRAYQKLNVLKATGPTKKGRIPKNWSALMAARTAATPARTARIVTPMGTLVHDRTPFDNEGKDTYFFPMSCF